MIKKIDANSWLSGLAPNSVQTFVLDPPYNVNYKYNTFIDNKPQIDYINEQVNILKLASKALKEGGSIFYLNYPENAADIWSKVDFMNRFEWITWIYNVHATGSPLRKASRAWLWFSKGEPMVNVDEFKGEYQNPNDKRVKQRIAEGHKPAGYDWWEVQQVKNVSKEKRDHPCQVPEKMVEKIIRGTSNEGDLIGDCYSGSATTGICALRNNRLFEGCDMDKKYVANGNALLKKIAKNPTAETVGS